MEEQTTGDKMVALVPQDVREVDFYGDILLVALVDGVPYVALRPIVDFLSIEWAPQFQRLQRDEILDGERRLVVMASADGRQREMVALPLEFLPGWLFGITGSRFKDPQRAEKLQRYRRECFRALWREFGQPFPASAPAESSSLLYVRDLGLAVAQMAEEQMQLQEGVRGITVEVDRAHARLDRAAEVVSNLHRRLTNVERRILPAEHISNEQATEISLKVKALAELLSRQAAQKSAGKKIPNYYQGVFSELYRRFSVTKYTLIRQDDYQDVLTFLDDWRKAAAAEGTNDDDH